MKKQNSKLRLAMGAAILMSIPLKAMALWGDRLELFVSDTLTTDSNVFRISGSSDPNTALGASSRSDTYNTVAAGLNLDVPVSRQRFQAGATLNQTRFHRFTDLNFDGHEAHALWLWQAGDPWNGQLGYTETKALASFSSFLGSTPTTIRVANPLTTRRAYGNATYAITPSWRLTAGLSQTEQRNANALRQENDIDVDDADVTISYISAAGNSVGISARQQDGRYPHPQLLTTGALLDNAYSQHSIGAVVDWTPTGKSHFNGRIDRLRRNYDQLSQRNYEGTTGRVLYDWRATGKFTLTASAQRDIAGSQDVQTSFILLKGITLRPTLHVTEKVDVAATLDYSNQDYLGTTALANNSFIGRSDRVRTMGATVTYRPMRSLTLLLSAQREARTSNVRLADYDANIVSLNARLAF